MITSPDTMNAPNDADRVTKERRLDAPLGNAFPAPERPVVKPTVSARQGVTGHNVRYVLIFGLIGVVVALVAVYFAYNT